MRLCLLLLSTAALAGCAKHYDCNSSAGPTARPELAQWEALRAERDQLTADAGRILDQDDCTLIDTQLTEAFTARADALLDLQQMSDRTEGRFARWADEHSTVQVSDRAVHQWTFCGLGDTAKRGLGTLMMTPGCIIHDAPVAMR